MMRAFLDYVGPVALIAFAAGMYAGTWAAVILRSMS